MDEIKSDDIFVTLTQEEKENLCKKFRYYRFELWSYSLSCISLILGIIYFVITDFSILLVATLVVATIILMCIIVDQFLSIRKAKKAIHNNNFEVFKAVVFSVDSLMNSDLLVLHIAYTSYGVEFKDTMYVTKEEYEELKFNNGFIAVICVSNKYYFYLGASEVYEQRELFE